MKTHPEICQAFDLAMARLEKHGISVRSDAAFHLIAHDTEVGAPETVDGLTAFADALDYSKSAQ